MFSLSESIIRGSRPELFCKKGVLKNFANKRGTSVLKSFLLKKRLWHRCVFLKNIYFYKTPAVADSL